MTKKMMNFLNLACLVHCAGIGIFTISSASFLHFGFLEIGLVVLNLFFGSFTIIKNKLSLWFLTILFSLGLLAIYSSIIHRDSMFHGLLIVLSGFQIYLSYRAMQSCRSCDHHK